VVISLARNERAVKALAELSLLIGAAMDLAQIGDEEALRRQLALIRDKLDELYRTASA
jgi:CO/xanthine dehydrogenase FAD-binding subunit